LTFLGAQPVGAVQRSFRKCFMGTLHGHGSGKTERPMSDVNQNDKTGDEEPTVTEAEKNR
jgi:hypothetical protein